MTHTSHTLVRALLCSLVIMMLVNQPLLALSPSVPLLQETVGWSYIAYTGTDQNLYLIPFNHATAEFGEPVPVTTYDTDTVRIMNLFWSPDGQWLAFEVYLTGDYSTVSLQLYSLVDGQTYTYEGDFSSNFRCCDWHPDSDRFVIGNGRNLDIVTMSDMALSTFLTPNASTSNLHAPNWSPDGSMIAFEESVANEGTQPISVYDVTNNTRYDWGRKCGTLEWSPESDKIYCDRQTYVPSGDELVFHCLVSGEQCTQTFNTPARETLMQQQMVPNSDYMVMIRTEWIDNIYTYVPSSYSLVVTDRHAGGSVWSMPYAIDSGSAYVTYSVSNNGIVAINEDDSSTSTMFYDIDQDQLFGRVSGRYDSWSPDGRYIAGFNSGSKAITVYDVNSQSVILGESGNVSRRVLWQPALNVGFVTTCGSWHIADYSSAGDPRIDVTPIMEREEETCSSIYAFENDTAYDVHLGKWKLLDLGSYTMQLEAETMNATASFITPMGVDDVENRDPLLTTMMPVQVESLPDAMGRPAEVMVTGNASLEALAFDAASISLQVLWEAIETANPGLAILPVDEQDTMARIILKSMYLFLPVVEYMKNGQFHQAYDELNYALDAFVEVIIDEFKTLGVEFAVLETLKQLIGEPADKAKLVVDILAYLMNRIHDQFKYGTDPEVITLAYEPE